ncbi:MAG: hypothetical protein HC831_12425 [Chloroflexia bacterium]|nr:hypothetical protein [Chloroflexia bacterium]
MKNFTNSKRIIAIVVCSMLFSVFVACNKQESDNVLPKSKAEDVRIIEKLPGVSAKGGRIIFTNRDVFETSMKQLSIGKKEISTSKYLKGFEKTYGITSFNTDFEERKRRVKDSKEASPFEDDVLASVLNQEGIVQIENYVFKIDMKNDKVYVVTEKDAALLTADLKSPKVMIFSTDDEVLSMLELGYTGSIRQKPTAVPTEPSFLCFRERGARGAREEGKKETFHQLHLNHTFSLEVVA